MRSLKELAQEALQVQDACNLSGVAHAFADVLRDLGDHTAGTDERNTHPVVRVFLNKMIDLAGQDTTADWNAVHELADDGK